ncbi:MAG: response regulator [Scytolyngbya sp. HA4215-MV1]|jgi:signal transduction histidine kinase|nr:response regulator [Scytolyngbya sp. HA4215-MV1]
MNQILIIEDDIDLLIILQQILEMNNFQVTIAENGIRGLEQLLRKPPDLVICDIDMPGLDGFSILSMLRQETELSLIPFIFMTGRSDRKDVRLGMELGADDYLIKPFSESEILKSISTQIEKKTLLEQLQNQQKQKLDSLKDQIITALPHEFNTPLNGIMLSLGFLQESLEELDPQEVREILEMMRKSAQRLNHLVKNFLLYAQLETIHSDLDRQQSLKASITQDPVDQTVLNTTQKCAAESQRARDLEIDLKTELGEAVVQITDSLLVTIVRELVDNALKFSEPETVVQVSCQVDQEWLTLQITDQGRGMTLDQVANVGACAQFDRAIYEQQGAGLGLAIVKRIVELHDGNISIRSIPCQETTVTVKLPLI